MPSNPIAQWGEERAITLSPPPGKTEGTIAQRWQGEGKVFALTRLMLPVRLLPQPIAKRLDLGALERGGLGGDVVGEGVGQRE